MVLCSELCCGRCRNVFNDIDRKPLTGTCAHSICEPCCRELDSSTCPTCERKEAFVKGVLEEQRGKATEEIRELLQDTKFVSFWSNKKDLNKKICSECQIETETLRICVDCNQSILARTGANGCVLDTSSELLEPTAMLAFISSICAGCVHKTHSAHHTVLLSSIENFPQNLKIVSVWPYSKLLQEQVKCQEKYGELKEAVTFFEQLSIESIMRRRSNSLDFMDNADVFRCKAPEFDKIVEESFGKVREHYLKHESLKARMTVHHVTHLHGHMRHCVYRLLTEACPEQRRQLQNALAVFQSVDRKLNCGLTLTKGELTQIDMEVDERMRRLVGEFQAKSKFPPPHDVKYFKFRVIREDLQAFNENILTTVDDFMQKTIELGNLCERHRRPLEQLTADMRDIVGSCQRTLDVFKQQKLSCLKIRHYAISRELLERQLELHDAFINYCTMNSRKVYADLSRAQYFGPELSANPDERVFIADLKKFSKDTLAVDIPNYEFTLINADK